MSGSDVSNAQMTDTVGHQLPMSFEEMLVSIAARALEARVSGLGVGRPPDMLGGPPAP